jgi:hypothetical protein
MVSPFEFGCAVAHYSSRQKTAAGLGSFGRSMGNMIGGMFGGAAKTAPPPKALPTPAPPKPTAAADLEGLSQVFAGDARKVTEPAKPVNPEEWWNLPPEPRIRRSEYQHEEPDGSGYRMVFDQITRRWVRKTFEPGAYRGNYVINDVR